jgi:hypothetical protein
MIDELFTIIQLFEITGAEEPQVCQTNLIIAQHQLQQFH